MMLTSNFYVEFQSIHTNIPRVLYMYRSPIQIQKWLTSDGNYNLLMMSL